MLPGGHSGKALQLNDLIELFSAPEVLDAQNTWYCPECTEHKEATSQLQIWNAPELLVVHLKRFQIRNQFQAVFNAGEKLNAEVAFPLVGLDLGPHLVENNDGAPILYDLYAVSNHFGSMGAGHYTACVRQENGGWINCDDSRCTTMDESDVVTPAAYVLFYQRRKSTPLKEEVSKEEPLDLEEGPQEDAPAGSGPSGGAPAAGDLDALD